MTGRIFDSDACSLRPCFLLLPAAMDDELLTAATDGEVETLRGLITKGANIEAKGAVRGGRQALQL